MSSDLNTTSHHYLHVAETEASPSPCGPYFQSSRPQVIFCRPVVPWPFIFIFLLSSLPLLRFVLSLTANYELPFTQPDDGRRVSSEIRYPMQPRGAVCQMSHRMLVTVVSRPAEFQLRRKIRESWADARHYDAKMTRVLFLVGTEESAAAEALLLEENRRFNDMVLCDVGESYYNLSIKTFALLRYQQLRCPSVDCLVKADSDNVLNIRNLERLCLDTGGEVIIGECEVSRRVIRSGSKWAVPFDVYPLPRYPQYCSTGTYFLSGRDTARKITQVAASSIFFQSANMRKLPEDVLFSGIFAELADVKRKSVEGLSFFGRPSYACVNGTYSALALHMSKAKDPAHYFTVLNLLEGVAC
ncbi:unnamed protein product, partial [Mesorhabditis spiculigera]